MSDKLPAISLSQAGEVAAACARANVACLLLGSPGVGKCLGKGTLVLMFDGATKAVENIVEGDLLMGPDGMARTVQSTTMGRSEMFRIDPVKGEPWVCNDVHVLTLVHSRSDEIVDIALDEYAKKGVSYKHYHKQFHVGVETFNSHAELPVDPYFLGLWFGDGTKGVTDFADGTTGLIGVRVSKPDPEVLQTCREIATKWGLHVTTTTSGGTRCPTHALVGSSGSANPLLVTLRTLVGADVKVPEQYLRADRSARLAFLAGFLDADAELADSNCFVISQKREDWARAVWWTARSLGLQATITTRKVKGYPDDYHVVTISGDTDQIPTRLPRKQATPRKQIKDATRTGFTVTSIGEGNYYGFMLDGDGRFLLGDFTVTHNTAISRAVSKALGLPCVTLIASNMEATDFAGLPYVDTEGRVQRALFPEIEKACQEPVILFLDEITAIPRSVEAPMLRLALERNAGGRQLHPGTRILMAGNPPEQAPGGITLSAAMINRVVQVNVTANLNEIALFFAGEPTEPSLAHLLDEESAQQAYLNEAQDFSLTIKHVADIVQFNPPDDSIADGAPWGSPRAWELGLRAYTALKREYAAGKGDTIGYAILCGMVGVGPGTTYLAQRELRKNLPTPDAVSRDPENVAVPTEHKYQVAAITVARRAAEIDYWAAFIWLDRFSSNEIKRAAASLVAKGVPKQNMKNPKFTKLGAAVFGRLVANVKTVL